MAVITPILKIYNSSSIKIQDSWNAGELDVSNKDHSESSELVINVWNNKGGNTNVPDLVGCNITTKNISGDNTDEQVVTELWVQACVDSMASTDSTGRKIFSKIGGETVCKVAHQGATGIDKTNCVLKGTANNGNPTTATNNYSKITLKVKPTINASQGVHYFKTRISGYYV